MNKDPECVCSSLGFGLANSMILSGSWILAFSYFQKSRTKPKLGQDPGRDLAWEISKEANAEIELGLSSQALD